jgi:catechol 1,2-dioxygenase
MTVETHNIRRENMPLGLVHTTQVQVLLDSVAGLDQTNGDPRLKQIIRRIVGDVYAALDEFDVSAEEFWQALGFLQQGAGEFGLIAPGLGFDRYLDILMDARDEAAGKGGGTPRTIEGPLYVAGAPVSDGFARLDDGTDTDAGPLIMSGTVRDVAGQPVSGAVVEVWHADSKGKYSFFDPSQVAYNYRRTIRTGSDGVYKFRTSMPSGYAVPPGGHTERLCAAIGRHGQRPAHIHFFVSAPGYQHLTTQINIAGDPFLYEDFAFATRDELIPDTGLCNDAATIVAEGLNEPFTKIEFDFALTAGDNALMARPRFEAAA